MPKKKMKPGRKPSKPSRRPFTLSVHGEGIDIDATIEDTNGKGDLGKLADAIVNRFYERDRPAEPSPEPPPKLTVDIASKYLDELMPTIDDEVLAAIAERIVNEQASRARVRDDAETQH
jgi:hypothetical protein